MLQLPRKLSRAMVLALLSLAIASTFSTRTFIDAPATTTTIQPQSSNNNSNFISTKISFPRVDQWSTTAPAPSTFTTVAVPSLEPRAVAPPLQSPRRKVDKLGWAKAWWVQPASYGLLLFDFGSLLVLISFWAKGWMDCRMNLTLSHRQPPRAPSPRAADDLTNYRQLQRSLLRAQQLADATAAMTTSPSPPRERAWTRFSEPSPAADTSSINGPGGASNRREAPLPPTPQGWRRYGAHAREYETWRRGRRERVQPRQSETQRQSHTLGPEPLPRRPPAQPRRLRCTPREMDVEEGQMFRVLGQVGFGAGADQGNRAGMASMGETENRVGDAAETRLQDRERQTGDRTGTGTWIEPGANIETHREPEPEAGRPIGTEAAEAETGDRARGM
ncbi:hypothetical protein W97_03075 [Coniosporium apollinis CBS 100218]|uniref:Transmembrane protein n=1 Tax=Coniosporium apollinis (strain CBS 100218) TaxID=1168221 RepID=R7YPM0_CONA1|nr:uncharacterized protein W97_03075 [Coniosporium apollinis CBS 100218]EON63847.1 hypothetical protein W97_03075 [Coniosporium apollinis CBS 100218]